MTIPTKFFALPLLIFLLFTSQSLAEFQPKQCGSNTGHGCGNKTESQKLKIIAIASILVASMAGICHPMFLREFPSLKPDGNLFVLVKAFSSGVILATGYMHVLPDSFQDLSSECLPKKPWRRFPFATFVAMLSAVFTLMMDSYTMSYFRKHGIAGPGGHGHGQNCPNNSINHTTEESQEFGHGPAPMDKSDTTQLLRPRVVAQILEMGIIVHSVVIGLSMGASDNPCTIRPLIAAICFHQFFEGMGLGGCILQAEYGMKMKAVMAFFFAVTTPFGVVLGMALTNVYRENSPTALIVVGLLNACSAGLLNYMALVNLLASDFMGNKLQNSINLQTWAYMAVLFGAGGMSIMAIWA